MKKIDIAEVEKWVNNKLEKWKNDISDLEGFCITMAEIKDFLERKKSEPEPCCANCKFYKLNDMYCVYHEDTKYEDEYCNRHEWRKESE